MFKMIGVILRYSLLVFVILVLSHIIQIKGVTLSQHVLNLMNLVGHFNPVEQAEKLTSSYSSGLKKRAEVLENLADGEVHRHSEISPEDEKELRSLIDRSRSKK